MHPLKSHNEEEEILKLFFCITAEYIYNLHIVLRITCNTEIKDKLAITSIKDFDDLKQNIKDAHNFLDLEKQVLGETKDIFPTMQDFGGSIK